MALRLRNARTVNVQRLGFALLLFALCPISLGVSSLAALGGVTAGLWAVIAYEKTVQTAFQESESALVSLDADRRRVALLTAGEVRARAAYEATRTGYARGLTDLSTTLHAEQSWRAIRAQLTAAQVQALRRSVQATKAIGGGWPVQAYAAK